VRSEYKGDLWTCDGCSKQTVVSDSEPPPGYTGTAADGLGQVWEWYACRKACVTKAIWAAYGRDS